MFAGPGVKRATVGLLSEVGLGLCSRAYNHVFQTLKGGFRMKSEDGQTS